VPNFIKTGQTVAEIWRFDGFYNGGRSPSWILEIQFFLTIWELKRHIMHNHAKFCEDLSIPCCDIGICVVFEDNDRRYIF